MTLATARESDVIGKALGRFSSTEYITRPERQAHLVLFGKSANRPTDGGNSGVTYQLPRVATSLDQQGHSYNHTRFLLYHNDTFDRALVYISDSRSIGVRSSV
jgi:hypothetical protein